LHKGDLVAVDGRIQINNYSTNEGLRRRDVEIDAVSIENLSTSLSKTGVTSDEFESSLINVGAKPMQKASSKERKEDLDAIFASEDEIPF
jgi:single-stranded DNA-binding protein